MYCVKCGVKLCDTEKVCPLCNTRVFHPDIQRPEAEPLYPEERYPSQKLPPRIVQVVLTAASVLAVLIVLLCDLQYTGRVTWSGFVMMAIALGYPVFILPSWFKRPHPIVFTPVTFICAGLYLLFADLFTGGDWFLSFAFPVTGGIGLIVTAAVILLSTLKRGRLVVVGGALVLMGAFMLLVEFLMSVTFSSVSFTGWSLYPLVSMAVVGGVLIFLGVCRSAREKMERRFFI